MRRLSSEAMRFRVTREDPDALACLIDSPKKTQTFRHAPSCHPRRSRRSGMSHRVTRQGADALACTIGSPKGAPMLANGPPTYPDGDLGLPPPIRQKRHPHTRWRCLFLDAQPLEMTERHTTAGESFGEPVPRLSVRIRYELLLLATRIQTASHYRLRQPMNIFTVSGSL